MPKQTLKNFKYRNINLIMLTGNNDIRTLNKKFRKKISLQIFYPFPFYNLKDLKKN